MPGGGNKRVVVSVSRCPIAPRVPAVPGVPRVVPRVPNNQPDSRNNQPVLGKQLIVRVYSYEPKRRGNRWASRALQDVSHDGMLSNMLAVIQATSDKQIEQARMLFREYEAWLGMDLCFQGFEKELKNLPGKYATPEGRLLLAYSDDDLAGCIALRKLEEGVCEMKRLYVRDGFRGQKIGVRLIEKLIEEAHQIGYKKMRLDTFPPKMGQAVKLYESRGFSPIPPYYNNPHDGVLFMELAL